ncbi:DNA polymerase III subunit epsilon [bacterium]|nr:DNA polymerase III subunit epsilon [bacterium]
MENGIRFRWLGMSPEGDKVVLSRYQGEFTAPAHATPQWFESHPDAWRWGSVLDVETTGTDTARDKVIEIGIRMFRFDRESGAVLSRDDGYGALEDPGEPLDPLITRITGITDAMVAGQKIDWDRVRSYLEKAQIIIAHNASFDRPFLDRYVPLSATKVWGCSFKQVDWESKGFPSQKLEILSIYHGFFNSAHRALADADSLLHLLHLPAPEGEECYLAELVRNARKKSALVLAQNSPFETKDILRERGYRWDPERRVWHRFLFAEECPTEVEWLTDKVYSGKFRGIVREIPLTDGFKPMGSYFTSSSSNSELGF